ncbi:MAG TPA: DoxX family protein [Daejeonella sp.]|nr:DoxX family protein [Daejeonella sp.]
MKKLFSVNHQSFQIDISLLIVRIAIAAMMLTHGLPKFAQFFNEGPVQFIGVFGMSASFSLALTVFAEVLCSVLILMGLGTRLATIPLIITMLVAVLYIHGSDPFVKQEMGLHYLLVYVLLFLTGSGKYSMDYFYHKKALALSLNKK